jgi:4,5-dihydroxyphthalate decarboxylase
MTAPLHVLLGDHPVTRALTTGAVASARVPLAFADVKVPHTAFKRVVRNLEFDVAELAIVTFLLAKAHGKPLVLLPAVVTARFQHPLLVHDASRGPLGPGDLAGRRVGLRSYSVTTATWLRGILADDHGVDLARVRWITFEEPHVAEFRDPPNVERAPADRDMVQMLLAGELDAAILGEAPRDERLRPVLPDPTDAAEAWRRRTGAIQINHVVVVKESVPAWAREEIWWLLAESRRLTGSPESLPFGLEANRRNLEVAVDCVFQQQMIPRRFTLEEMLR